MSHPMTDSLEHEAAVQHTIAAGVELARQETLSRPSYLLHPRLSIDGNQWCALYGENLQDGVAGFGDSPEAAYAAFDKAWHEPLAAIRAAREG